eukprot:1392830-Amorphochlora_amoeboformis.AAC.1
MQLDNGTVYSVYQKLLAVVVIWIKLGEAMTNLNDEYRRSAGAVGLSIELFRVDANFRLLDGD